MQVLKKSSRSFKLILKLERFSGVRIFCWKAKCTTCDRTVFASVANINVSFLSWSLVGLSSCSLNFPCGSSTKSTNQLLYNIANGNLRCTLAKALIMKPASIILEIPSRQEK